MTESEEVVETAARQRQIQPAVLGETGETVVIPIAPVPQGETVVMAFVFAPGGRFTGLSVLAETTQAAKGKSSFFIFDNNFLDYIPQ